MSRKPRVTARLYRTEAGEVLREYHLGGVAYSSVEEVEAVLESR